jgi:hypothetical protein
MGIYNSVFIRKLRKQLALDNFTIRKDSENPPDSYIIYSPRKDEYYLFCPYEDVFELMGFNSGTSPYQKACDENLIKTHIKHCESVLLDKRK